MLHIERKEQKGTLEKLALESDRREEQCIEFMKEGRYAEFEHLLKILYDDREWRPKRPFPFQHILEEALERKDQKAVQIVLPLIKIINPVSMTEEKLITEDPALFRQLAESGKLDWSPNHQMYISTPDGPGEKGFFVGNLLEILIFSQNTECVKILLENVGNGYLLKKKSFRERTSSPQTDHLYNVQMEWRLETDNGFMQTPLPLAIRQRNKDIVKILMEKKGCRDSFSLDMLGIRYGRIKEDSEFHTWFLEEYTDCVMKQFTLNWFMHHATEHPNRTELLKKYKQHIGLEALLEELKRCVDEALLEQQCEFFWGMSSFMEGILYCLYHIKKIAKNREEENLISETERQCFEKVRGNPRFAWYPLIFLTIADYWYRREKVVDSNIIDNLLNIYLYWDRKPHCFLFDLEENYDREKLQERNIRILNRLIEHAKMENYVFYVRNSSEKVLNKRISYVMDLLNPEKNRIIERGEEKSSFLAFLLFQNSVMLLRKAWKKHYLTKENLSLAIDFAVQHEKRKILPYLFEYMNNETVERDRYIL